jgi:peroxiredoxin
VGRPAPDFTLNNLKGKPQTLAQLLKKGPVVLTWYRGGWCPYCNLALQYYESQLQPALVAKGITLVALAPELPEKGLKTQQKHKLTYTLLTDLHNEVARRYGVAFRLTEDLQPLYKAWVGLENYNGDDRSALPLAATFLISPDGIIRWRWVHADYKQRATPEDILKAIAEWEPTTGR